MKHKGWKGSVVGGEQVYQKGDHRLFVKKGGGLFGKGRPVARLFHVDSEGAASKKVFDEGSTLKDLIDWADGEISQANPSRSRRSTRSSGAPRSKNPLGRVRKSMSDAQQRKVVSENIEREIEAGKPQKQAVAIALNQRRKDLGMPPKANPTKSKLIINEISRIDSCISEEVISFLKKKYKSCDGFLIESFRLPRELGMLDCDVYGPVMGDRPIPDSKVSYERISGMSWDSRTVDKPTRKTSMITVIIGPHQNSPCVLYAAYGGPSTPSEVANPGLHKDKASLYESEEFWKSHAISRPKRKFKRNENPEGDPSKFTLKFALFLPDHFRETGDSGGRVFYAPSGGLVKAENVKMALGGSGQTAPDMEDVYIKRGEYITSDRFFSKKYGPIQTLGVDTVGHGKFVIIGEVLTGPDKGRSVKMLAEKLIPTPSKKVFWHGKSAAKERKAPAPRPHQSQKGIIAGLYMSQGMSAEDARRAAGMGEAPSAARQEAAPKMPDAVADKIAQIKKKRQEKEASKQKESPKPTETAGEKGAFQEYAESINLKEMDSAMSRLSTKELSEIVSDMSEKWAVSEALDTITRDFGEKGRVKWMKVIDMGRKKLAARGAKVQAIYSKEEKARLMNKYGAKLPEIARKLGLRKSEVEDILKK